MTKTHFNAHKLERHISVTPDIQHGKPCIRNTRTPVYVILEALSTGMSFEQIKKEFSPLTEEDIRACVYFGALLANEQELILQSA